MAQRNDLRAYGGRSGEQRRTERRAALLAVGLELLGTPGGGELTVRAACEQASVTTRYFYESFADRDALAGAVYDQVVAEVADCAAAAVDAATGTGRERIRAGVAAIVSIVAQDPRKGLVLFEPRPTEAFMVSRRAAAARLFTGLFLERLPGAPEPHAGISAYFAVGGLARVLTAWLADELVASQAEVTDACTDLLAGVKKGQR